MPSILTKARLLGLAACLLPAVLHCVPLRAQTVEPGVVFSTARPGSGLPSGWQNRPVLPGKKMTGYVLVADQGTTVLEADASGSASGLVHEGDFDLNKTPVVSWRWKVAAPIQNADNRVADREDSPARLVFFFGGQVDSLSIGDRAEMFAAHALGESLPYATLMYIWSNSAAPGTVIENPHSSRVQMIVVGNEVGKWQSLRRNVVADFEKVFHEKPGKLTGYGILTDTDNTGGVARAWYGDIRFSPQN
ncbi:DUF3047 domain-containing protein [Cupriavidus metallidurans]|uniref:DUF3047 domain-containing protein n=1 Tax=Cupriavidus TaxID=106589 RepID=UPI0009B8BFA0|nr:MULTISPECIES: DUF3047 domain-containing protein [Cupriavidus]HBD32669.1 DUF3047 domain-containing protein [Cupriavidus sp.]HBO77741.1 DUF3047 domain-containing protein [Cupriavidus sp.]